jgi:hypothetical protein
MSRFRLPERCALRAMMAVPGTVTGSGSEAIGSAAVRSAVRRRKVLRDIAEIRPEKVPAESCRRVTESPIMGEDAAYSVF